MTPHFSYRHLYYFWVVGKEGGMARAAERLDMAVQTVSTQVRELERALGASLLKPAGRGLALTEAGVAALAHAEQIFALGEQLPDVVRDAASTPRLRLAVGITDGLPKLVASRLMQPVIDAPHLRLLCREGRLEELVAELALHRLDLVLTDRAAAPQAQVRLHSHSLGASPIGWYAAAPLRAAAQRGFPRSLAEVPVLLPTSNAAVRPLLDHWFEKLGVLPRIVGEVEDSALLKTFGASGMGVFPAAQAVHEDLERRYGVRRIGVCEGVKEQFYGLSLARKVQHPLVQRILAEAHALIEPPAASTAG